LFGFTSSVYPFVIDLDSVKRAIWLRFVCVLVFLPNINFAGFSFLGKLWSPRFMVQAACFFEDVWNPSLIVQVQSYLLVQGLIVCLASSGVLLCCSLFRFSV
jgi:hypothetical protein